MDSLDGAMEALLDTVADLIATGFATSISQHEEHRECARDLRDGAAVQALLGPKVLKVLLALTHETKRKTIERFDAYRQHPRHRHEPLIDEGEAADVSLNSSLLNVSAAPTGGAKLAAWADIIRVQAVTATIGPKCIYPTHVATVGARSGPRQRRREITAADLPEKVAELVLLAGGGDESDRVSAFDQLRTLELSDSNVGGIVTKLLALAGLPDGGEHLNRIATRLERAQFDRKGAVPRDTAPTTSLAPPPPPPPVPSSYRVQAAEPPQAQARRPGAETPGNPLPTTAEAPQPTATSAGERARESLGRVPSRKLSAAERIRQQHERLARKPP